ncbi:MAG: hypothetical protein KatS3mg115_0110 [Candidatus Poribacteria bacterium]|nr:MAG: hypothetical protein KatS3mg115_0110 [Candidatus Poribacteria bacterium]
MISISVEKVRFPRMVRVHQEFPRPRVEDIPQTVAEQLGALGLESRIRPGQTVALTAGSRGIADIATVLRAVVDFVKSLGAEPFIVPAMGSHGGATAEGQLEVLHHYGITEEAMGCKIRSSMEAVKIGETVYGTPVYCDKHAFEADHIGVINRVKPHTDFHGEIESGLCKMMAIGLGKQYGANHYHRAFLHYPYQEILEGAARVYLESGKVAFGLAIVENAYEETARLVAVRPEELIPTEKKLLSEARTLMGRLPFDELDCLIVDLMGKDISGTGMDMNVIGREMFPGLYPLPEGAPRIMRIFVRDLSPLSYGNAAGIGFADVTTTRLVQKIDKHATMMNTFTSLTPHGMRIPVWFDTDREALAMILSTLGLTPPERSRTVRIRSTLHLTEMLVSEALLPEVQRHPRLKVAGQLEEIVFDENGNLLPL